MESFTIKTDKNQMQLEQIQHMLAETYWAGNRTVETIQKAINHSLCYGAFLNGTDEQVGFARVITDYATTYYICDVIVDKNHRRQGIASAILQTIASDQTLAGLFGILITRDCQPLYRKFGFKTGDSTFMDNASQPIDFL